MKKIIAILLIALVAGFAFAATENHVDANLKIVSIIDKLYTHGFYAYGENGHLDTSDAIFDETFTDVGDGESDVYVEMKESGDQEVAFYSFASNSYSGVDIGISATAMTSGNNKVPFSLIFTKKDGIANVSSKTFLVPKTGLSLADDNLYTIGTGTSEISWGSYLVTVDFDDVFSQNATFSASGNLSLPAGTYVSTITAQITNK